MNLLDIVQALNLDTIKKLAPWAALTFAIFVSFYLTRRYAPKLWAWPALLPLKSRLETWIELVVPLDRLSSYLPLVNLVWTVWQGLPAVLVGAMVDAVQNHVDVGHAWRGALAGALAPVVHHALKALPVPYQGALAIAVKGGIVRPRSSLRDLPPPPPPMDGGGSLAAALLVAIALALGQTGCAFIKPVARTVDDIASAMCAQFFSSRQGISLEDAERAFCKTHEQLEPFIDQALKARQAAGELALKRSTESGAGGGE